MSGSEFGGERERERERADSPENKLDDINLNTVVVHHYLSSPGMSHHSILSVCHSTDRLLLQTFFSHT